MLQIRRISVILLVLVLVSSWPVLPTARLERRGPADFRKDLEFFARELPQRHKNAFHFTSKEQFESAVHDLQARLDTLDEDEFYVGLKRIASTIGDSHTQVRLPENLERVFPLGVHKLDDYRVLQVAPGLEKALGARVIRIDDTPAERFYELLSPLAAQNENPGFGPALVNRLLSDAAVLHGAGIMKQRNTARFTLEDETGQQFTMTVEAIGADTYSKITWIPIAKPRLQEIAEPMRHPSPMFAYTYVPQARTVYANVRRMVDLKGPCKELLDFIRERRPDKLIIDLRTNPGGDYFHGLHSLIEPITKLAEINRKGHLFVLIGPMTGSAAVINAVHFHTMTKAILVGEPIGAKPSEYAELQNMTLPRTRFIVGYSIRFYDFAYNKENIVTPDHEAPPSWDEVKHGINRALEWCLEYKE
jgi:hypothetical protein